MSGERQTRLHQRTVSYYIWVFAALFLSRVKVPPDAQVTHYLLRTNDIGKWFNGTLGFLALPFLFVQQEQMSPIKIVNFIFVKEKAIQKGHIVAYY